VIKRVYYIKNAGFVNRRSGLLRFFWLMSLFEVVLQWVTALLLQTVYLFIRIIYEGFEVAINRCGGFGVVVRAHYYCGRCVGR